jgi:DnaJ-class molecular chaperone
MRDPYEILGVSRTADPPAIKSAFRKLAKKLHPDANKADPQAANRFAELNAAYEILGEDEKRKAFDRGEIDAEGKPRFQGFEGAHPGAAGFGGDQSFRSFKWGNAGAAASSPPGAGFGGFEDILKDMFSGGGRPGGRGPRFDPSDFTEPSPAGRDLALTMSVTLPEAAKGVKKRVAMPNGKEIEVRIPAGLADGQQIRLKGQGLPGSGGAGDALISVTIEPHPLFERDGTDLRLELPIALYEAVLGAKIRVPTLDGAVELAIPPNTNAGRTFRLKGKGMPSKTKAGDLLARVRIVLPDQPSDELEALMRKLRDQAPYDPRRDLA